MDMGDRIQRAWRSFVKRNISASWLKHELRGIKWDDRIDIYFYAVIGEDKEGEPYVDRFEDPTLPDYFQGPSSSELVLAIPAYEGITKKDLLDFDAAEESNHYDHPDWSDV
jgi:hypothetical protein